MDLESFRRLLTDKGQLALTRAMSYSVTLASYPACVDRLSRLVDVTLAKAAVEMAYLRAKAREKFPLAENLYFTREALEQSTGPVVAAHHARRFTNFRCVADLCCGLGGDTSALAAAGRAVIAIEQDPLLAEITKANLKVLGLAESVEVLVGDVLSVDLPGVSAAFADPSRRKGQSRVRSLAHYQPPPDAIRGRFPADFPLAFKIAPGVNHDEIRRWDAEAEFISLQGELKECVLWCGPLKTTGRRATVLFNDGSAHTMPQAATSRPIEILPDVSSPQEYLFDPDPTVIRAQLEHQLAEQLALRPLDSGLAFFTARCWAPTPFGRWYRVEQSQPFQLRQLRASLRQLKVGRVTLLTRGRHEDVNAIKRSLDLRGDEHRHVIITRSGGRPWAIIAQPIDNQTDDRSFSWSLDNSLSQSFDD